MTVPSFAAIAVVFFTLTTTTYSQMNSSPAVARLQAMAPAVQSATTHFSVYLPLTHTDALGSLLQAQTDVFSGSYRHWLTPAEFKAQFGPSPADVAKVKGALEAAGFKVVAEHTQNLEVEGPVSSVETMFATRLQQTTGPSGRMQFAAVDRPLTLPSTLASVGAVIPEFTSHLAAHVHSVRIAQTAQAVTPNSRTTSTDSFFYPNDLNEAYQFPSFLTGSGSVHPNAMAGQVNGAGVHIGIVISSVIDPSDLAKTFNSTLTLADGEKVTQAYSSNTKLPVPTVQIRNVGDGSGPFDPTSDGAFEASLDTQMSLGTAPGAQETIYSVENLHDAALLAAYTDVDEDNAVDVVSSSFGECELDFAASHNGGTDFSGILNAFHSLFVQGNAQGITFVASTGDNGAVPCISAAFATNPTNGTSFIAGVQIPSSDPNVTAVGGTNLTTTATPGVDDATYSAENANYDPRVPAEFDLSPTSTVYVNNNTWGSGGGYSAFFGKPAYQGLVDTGSNQYRAVPDVSMMMGGCPTDADMSQQNCKQLPRSAALIWVAGAIHMLAGTSVSAPELAGVLALTIQLNGGRLGNVNPLIYSLSALQTIAGGVNAPPSFQFFHRGITGDNNLYKVVPGQAYSTVLGNSTLNVKNFLLLQQADPAGAPDTPTNP